MAKEGPAIRGISTRLNASIEFAGKLPDSLATAYCVQT